MRKKSVFKSRSHVTQEEWMELWNNYDKYVSREDIELLALRTKKEMLAVTKGKKCAYAYSGGKDSVALAILCNEVGIYDGVCAISDLFFDCSIEHIKRTLPEGVELINTGEGIEWLSQHQDMIFIDDMFKWYKLGHLKAQKEYHKKHNLDLMIKGKRTQDGNNIGKDLIRTNSRTGAEYNPIRDWTHEEVIAFIRYRGKTLSPFYWTKYGFHFGDVEYPSMNLQEGMTHNDMWAYIESIEPDKVIACAEGGIQSAIEYLKQKARSKE